MPHRPFERKAVAVPSSRLSRLSRLGGLASSIAGAVAADAARRLARGERPRMEDLLLTPANARKLADELARMRGAAMKVGQLISMDAGDLLPPEMADILARLRAEAHHMPWVQLRRVLNQAWGAGWREKFAEFDIHPIAAASIGQVHRARDHDGRALAIKVQYPGVRASIDSDVNNVATLIRIAGLVPKTVEIAPMIAEAKRQLHEEADYQCEGARLKEFGALLADSPDFCVPALHQDLTRQNVLAMDFVAGGPIDDLEMAPQAERDRAMTLLIGLLFRELFEFRLMQTDPNFANYRYAPENGRIVLLDFGATRAFDEDFVALYRRLLRSGVEGDRAGMRDAARTIGFLAPDAPEGLERALLDMFDLSIEPLRQDAPFDFGASDLAARLRDAGMALAAHREHFTLPPMDALFLQRKFGGIYLLATRMRARVALRGLLVPHL